MEMVTRTNFPRTSLSRSSVNASVLSEPDEKRIFVRRMFDGIAGTYDLLNRVLSMGTDVTWRRKTVDALAPQPGERILDLATGTGDLGLEAAGRDPGIAVTGADISTGMLRYGLGKGRDRAARMTFLAGDAERLPFEDAIFDGLTIGFGIRNVAELDVGLSEMVRVLKPGGRVAILEFSQPHHFLMRTPYLFYFRNVLPNIGRLVSKDPSAYRYLYESVMRFPEGDVFCDRMRGAGFVDVVRHPLTFGIATIYVGRK